MISKLVQISLIIALSALTCTYACGVVYVDPGPPEACASPPDAGPPAPPPSRPPPAPFPRTASGKRLKAAWRVAEDGAREFLRFHDALLDVDCGWVTASDGAERCLPVNDPRSGNTASYYADEGCAQRLVLAPVCEAGPPLFGVRSVSSPCGVTWTVTEVGAPWEGPVWQQPIGAAPCTKSALPKGYGVWLSLGEVDPESFVEGHVEVDP